MKEWQWKKAIASVLGAFVLLVGTSGLTSCGFPGGEQEEVEESEGGQVEQQGDDEQEEDGDDDD
jgi:hypothetical protein